MKLPVDQLDMALFATATKVTVHNGKTASFWLSSWLPGSAPALMFPQLYKHSKRKNQLQRLCKMSSGLLMSCRTSQSLFWMSLSNFGAWLKMLVFIKKTWNQTQSYGPEHHQVIIQQNRLTRCNLMEASSLPQDGLVGLGTLMLQFFPLATTPK
jgi:hypothetical protein